jgi:hypothetical protein
VIEIGSESVEGIIEEGVSESRTTKGMAKESDAAIGKFG